MPPGCAARGNPSPRSLACRGFPGTQADHQQDFCTVTSSPTYVQGAETRSCPLGAQQATGKGRDAVSAATEQLFRNDSPSDDDYDWAVKPNTKTSLQRWSQLFRQDWDEWREIAKKSHQNHRLQGGVDVEMRWCCKGRTSESSCMMSTGVNKAHCIPDKAEDRFCLGVRCFGPLVVVSQGFLLLQELHSHSPLAKVA